MLKFRTLAFVITLGLIGACTESLPPISFDPPLEVLKDTTYLQGSISDPAQDKGILIEDLTGVRCVNCPDAAASAKQLKDNNPNRVVIAGIYTATPVVLTFPHDGTEDLRTQWASDIYTNLYGSPPLPGGGVNRKIFSGQNQINQQHNLWGSSVQTERALKSIVNLDVSTAHMADSVYVLKTKIQFREDLAENAFITIMLLENDIEAAQSTISGEDHHYVHEHVLRKMYTAYNGDPLYSTPEEGRVIEKDYVLAIPEHVNTDHASFVVFINFNEADNKEVLHVKEVKL